MESRGGAGAGVNKWASGQFAGDVYDGEYKDDVYDGEYKDDKKHGRGTRGGGGRGCSVSGSIGMVTGQENEY